MQSMATGQRTPGHRKGRKPGSKNNRPSIPGYRSEEEQAARLGISIYTLRRWRRAGIGPRPIRLGRNDLYPENEEARFLDEKQAAAEHKPRGRGRPRGGVIR
jgi:hypothetical protein